MEYLKYCDLVVSATSSPNCTVKYSEVTQVRRKKKVIMIDLAVPRDIDKAVGELEGVTLYDIDSFGYKVEHEKLRIATEQAMVILNEFIADFNTWYSCRDLVPMIQEICKKASVDAGLRMTKSLKKLSSSEKEKDELKDALETATSKVVNKMLFGLRDSMELSAFHNCLEHLQNLFEV